MKNIDIIKNLMVEYERPFYIYDESTISNQIENLLGKFPQFEILYSLKTNPHKSVVNFILNKGIGADAASSQEVITAHEIGLPCEKILYSAPGKTHKDIEKTIEKSIIIADSYNELALIDKVAKEKNLNVKVGIRINPDYNMDMGKGDSSKFGVDEETLIQQKDFINSLNNIEIIGIHVHIRSQELDYTKLYKYYEKVFELSLFCKENMNFKLEFVNFGGGIGLAYSKLNDKPLNLELLSLECDKLIEKFKEKVNARLIIESGRFLVCEAGQYVTHVVDIKESRGTKYLVTENGLNGFIRPAMAEYLMAYTSKDSDLKMYEPLFTTRDAFEFTLIQKNKSKEKEKVNIMGNLCTAVDIMAKDIEIEKASIGDILLVSKAGSYAYTLSPVLFGGHPSPLEFYIKQNGEIV